MALSHNPVSVFNVFDAYDTYLNVNFKYLVISFFRVCTAKINSESGINNKVSVPTNFE